MLRKAENKVKIEGILSQVDLKYGSFERKSDGAIVENIGGSIKVLVEQNINGQDVTLEVPVHMFSTKFTKAGTINPAYESIEKVMKEFVSIAACGSKDQADKVRITAGEIKMNEFVGQKGTLVSQPRVHANFVSKVTDKFSPEASFTLEFMVNKFYRELDAEGVELDPPRLVVEAMVPQYTSPNAAAPNVDAIKLVAVSPKVIDGVETYWENLGCFKVSGRLNFSSRTEEVIQEVDFGEAQTTTRTINVNELIITGGSQAPLEGDFAFDYEDIKAGMAARNARIEDMKSGKKSTAKQAPAQNTPKGSMELGF